MSQRRSGFSLIEMAVVVAILSIVAVFGVDISRGAIKGADRLSTQEKLQLIKRALDDYGAQNGHLPCPARRNLTPNDTTFGIEVRNGTTGCRSSPDALAGDITLTAGVLVGMVPVRSLSLPDSYASDAWGNKFTYNVSFNHVNSIQSYANNDNGTIIINGGYVADVDGDGSADNYVMSTQKTGGSGSGATFAVVSHGPNGVGAYPLYGIAVATACTQAALTDRENCDNNDNLVYDAEYNDGANNATFFDDYVVWGTNATSRSALAAALTTPACAAGTCDTACATCTMNVGMANSNRSAMPADAQRLCAKWITNSSPTLCRATCLWGGRDSVANRYYPCP